MRGNGNTPSAFGNRLYWQRNGKGPVMLSVQAEAMIQPLAVLDATYRAFGKAEDVVVKSLGVPICMQGCGKCCEVTTVMSLDVEAQYAASALMGTPDMARTLSICEGWLLDRDGFTVFGLTGKLTDEQQRLLDPEVQRLLFHRPCPFLASDKSCSVHDVRPLVCRAYGVTRMPGQICPRPLSKLESTDVRGHIGALSPLGLRLRNMVESLLQQSAPLGWVNVRFLATALYMLLQPQKFTSYAADGLIPSAKMVVFGFTPAILFQDQLEQVWSNEVNGGGLLGSPLKIVGSPQPLETQNIM